MPGVEAGVSTATMVGPSVNAAPSFAALGDMAPAFHGEVAPITSLDGFVAYNPTMDADMRGFEGRATPLDVGATPSITSADIFSQVADVASAAETAFAKEQSQRIGLYTALYGISVSPAADVQEVTAPVSDPVIQNVPEFAAPLSIAQVETHAEQAVEAVAKEVIAETRSPEEIGQEADAALSTEVEALARELNLHELANRVAAERAEAIVQQAAVTIGLQTAEEVVVEGEVLEESAVEPSAQQVSITSSDVAARGEVASGQLLPEEEEQAVAEDDQAIQEDPAVRWQDEARKPGGALVDEEGPMKAVETNERRRGIATEVVEEAKEKLEAEGEILGEDLARRFRERANAQALSPILNGQGPDGSVDYIVAPLEGQRFEDTDAVATVLQRGVSAYTAVTVGNRKDATLDDVARVYEGSRRGVLAAA